MTGLPAFKFEIESSTPGTWYDITAYVKLPSDVSIERGRRDEEDAIDASYVNLELDNSDGRFTYGAAGYQIRTDQRLRITWTLGATVSRRFVGYVQDWPVAWLSPVGNFARCAIVATDRMARLARRDVASLVQSEVVVDSPMAYYTLGEPTGSLSAGDTSGKGALPLVVAGAGAPVVFGEGIGPVDGLSAAEFAGGQYLARADAIPPGGAFTVEAFVAYGAPGGDLLSIDGGSAATNLLLSVGGNITASTLTITASAVGAFADGETHHVAVSFDGSAIRLYVDGTQRDTSITSFVPAGYLAVGKTGLAATVSHVALFPIALSPDRIAQHAKAGLVPEGDSTDGRIARYAQYANIPPGEQSLEAGLTRSVTAPTDSSKTLEAMQEVSATEGGVIFIDGAGLLVFQNRAHRVFAATSAAKLTLAAEFIDADDVVVSADKQYLVNTITGARPDGTVQAASNPTSIALYEQYPDTQTLLVTTDREVLDAIQWQVYAYGTPKPRVPVFTLDLMTLPQSTVQTVLGLEIGDRVVITALPSQSPLATLDLIIEGWVEELSDDSWSMTFNTSPADLFRAWVLEDATYGVLETTTRLYY